MNLVNPNPITSCLALLLQNLSHHLLLLQIHLRTLRLLLLFNESKDFHQCPQFIIIGVLDHFQIASIFIIIIVLLIILIVFILIFIIIIIVTFFVVDSVIISYNFYKIYCFIIASSCSYSIFLIILFFLFICCNNISGFKIKSSKSRGVPS